ncbi:MAG: cation diffusion facilitator family transporter [Bacteroidota bacterium]
MNSSESKLSIFLAIAANLAIAVMKFIASFFTGSAAMLSEGIHSLIDTANGGLLLVGIKRSKKAADKDHPFGYGKEAYFWSFIVAVMVFALGGGVALYEGIIHIIHPIKEADHSQVLWSYGVLIGAMIFEGSSLWFAIKQFRKTNPSGFKSALEESKDTSTLAVIVEETAAMIGLIIALMGVTVTYFTKDPVYDAIASIMIGVLLTYVAYFMANEIRALLVGEAVADKDMQLLNSVLKKYDKEIEFYGNIRTMHLGPDEAMAGIEINFEDRLTIAQIEPIVLKIKDEIREKSPKFTHIYIESDSIKKSDI